MSNFGSRLHEIHKNAANMSGAEFQKKITNMVREGASGDTPARSGLRGEVSQGEHRNMDASSNSGNVS